MIPKPSFKRRVPKAGHRSKFPKRIKEAILERDDYRCQRCGSPYDLTIHHIVERSRGGRGVYKNGITLCGKCHFIVQQDESKLKYYRDMAFRRYGPHFWWDEYDRANGS